MPRSALEHTASYYAASRRYLHQWPCLDTELQADVCIIGGGFTGLASALELAERGRSVVLLEARQIGWGASGRNGGQLIRGLGHHLAQFLPQLGAQGVAELERMAIESVQLVKQRIERHQIDCDLRWGFCELANKASGFEQLKQQYEQLMTQGYAHPLQLLNRDELGQVIHANGYQGGLFDGGSGHLHPLNLALGEAVAASELGVQLYEHSPVCQIERGQTLRVHTPRGSVRCEQVIVACNAYLGDLLPELTGRILPAESYLIATEPLGELAEQIIPSHAAFCDQRIALDYFRLSADGRLLFGGACHYLGRSPANIGRYMQGKMLKVFPQLANCSIDYQWAGLLAIGANRLPQIGHLAEQPNIYYAQGYAGHGINVSHLAGHLLAEAICAGADQRIKLFQRIQHPRFPGGRLLRSPLLALGMLWYQLKETLGR